MAATMKYPHCGDKIVTLRTRVYKRKNVCGGRLNGPIKRVRRNFSGNGRPIKSRSRKQKLTVNCKMHAY